MEGVYDVPIYPQGRIFSLDSNDNLFPCLFGCTKSEKTTAADQNRRQRRERYGPDFSILLLRNDRRFSERFKQQLLSPEQ